MKITFLGAAHEVTGSCTLLEACGRKKYLLTAEWSRVPIYTKTASCPVRPPISILFSHTCAYRPFGQDAAARKNGFCGTVYSTRATRDLAAIMLADSANIQQSEAVWKNRRAKRSRGRVHSDVHR